MKHGGKREGSGRKATGITKKVSLTLTDETWNHIEQTKQAKNMSQSALLRELIENHTAEPVIYERSKMWWEIVRKNIFEGYIEIRRTTINECISYNRQSKELANEVWERCIENSKAYKRPRVSYLLEAFVFEGKRLLLDESFATLEEQVIFAIIEYVRLNRKR